MAHETGAPRVEKKRRVPAETIHKTHCQLKKEWAV